MYIKTAQSLCPFTPMYVWFILYLKIAYAPVEGRRVHTYKGNVRKGFFHLPRRLLECCEVLTTKTGATVTDNHVEFTADAPEVEISFRAPSGESIGMNAISLRKSLLKAQ